MKKQNYTCLIFALTAIFFLLDHCLVYAEINDNSRVVFMEGEFSIGNRYCTEEQNNSDWCADEIPHQIKLKDFSMDKYEVTNSEYMKCFAEGVCNPNELHETRPDDFSDMKQPVVFVSWKDAQTFCNWRGGNLPTEAQWERAAQGDNLGGAHFKQVYNSGATEFKRSFRYDG